MNTAEKVEQAEPFGLGTRVARAWDVLGTVLDPEVPALSVCDLGLVRDIIETSPAEELEIVLTPTYSGCPATELIERNVIEAVVAAGLGPARVQMRRAPAWTSDWISDEGKRKLRDYGIAPPGACAPSGGAPVRFSRHAAAVVQLECPRCGSHNTTRLSEYGSTACKSLYRCLACMEPFEHFKPI